MLSSFFGWCSVINIGFLVFATLLLTLAGQFSLGLHKRLFDLDEKFLKESYFRFLARYKMLTLIFSIVPYFALQLIINNPSVY